MPIYGNVCLRKIFGITKYVQCFHIRLFDRLRLDFQTEIKQKDRRRLRSDHADHQTIEKTKKGYTF